MLDGVDVAKKILHHIASCSPHVTNPGQPTERICALCLTFIDEARAALNYEPWPAIPHTPKKETDTYPLAWLYTHCRAIGMSCRSESGKMAHDIALFTMNLQEEIRVQTENVNEISLVMINLKAEIKEQKEKIEKLEQITKSIK
jgi:hypothetical protein